MSDHPAQRPAPSGESRVVDDESSPLRLPWLVALAAYYVGSMVLIGFHRVGGALALAVGLAIFWRPLVALIKRYLFESWRQLNAEAAAQRSAVGEDGRIDARLPLVFATSAVVLTAIEYYGGSGVFSATARKVAPALSGSRYFALMGLTYWSLFRLVGYVLVPMAALRLLRPRERMRDYGLSTRGFVRHLKVYALLYLVVLPPLVVASTTAPFRRIYPFYKLAGRSWLDFCAWEALYTLQFFALELFFRGFMLHPLKPALGAYSIFAMALPYCMIHFDKPVTEAVGAFVAGTVLGTLSLRTRSIWAGVLIHATVAITMDTLAVIHHAGYPGNPRFVW